MSSALVYGMGSGQERCVSRVEFGLLSSEDIRRLSVVQVKDPIIYDRALPRTDGVNDLRMGTVDRRLRCGTCGGTVDACPGHSGHIELPVHCYHAGFLDHILKSLRCVCFFCSRLLCEPEDCRFQGLPTRGRQRLQAVSQVCRSRRGACRACGGMQPAYSRHALAIRTEFGADARASFATEEERAFATRPFTAFDAHSVLRHVPDDDLRVMGFEPSRARPDMMVFDVLLVPPPITRPSIMAVEGSRARGQDDLTHKLQDILKSAQVARAAVARDGGPSHDAAVSRDVAAAWEALQFHVATYYDNDIRGLRQSLQRSGAPSRCLKLRIKGKEGRIRGNLMGKRVDFAARSVISGDPVIDPDEVGVPEAVARLLTVPEKVTPWNVDDLTARVHAGPNSLLGARSVVTDDGRLVHLGHVKDRAHMRLGHGWTVERFLRDGDHVVFNRQPSLHRMSMMGHRVRIMPEDTFRLNLACCTPYNADFDGDEMNLHVPQSPAAAAEVENLMMVPLQLINPQNNRPVMGIVQDALVGCFMLTQRRVFLTPGDASSLRLWIRHAAAGRAGGEAGEDAPAVLWPTRRYTGKQVLSLVVPPIELDLTVREGSAGGLWGGFDDPEERRVLVRRGRLLSGATCGKVLKTAHGGLVHVVARDHGPHAAVRFMGDCQRVVNQWLAVQGFSAGPGDCVLRDGRQGEAREAVGAALAKVGLLRAVADAHGGDKVCGGELEGATAKLLSGVLNEVGSVVRAGLRPRNSLETMVRCGSKGSPINLSQISGCVGQQSVEGRRIGAGSPRSLPCFRAGDDSARARGFVERSYVRGLRPAEFFFHAMGGREGLVDTAVKTATTGYTQRKLMKAMESVRVEPDRSVRHALGTVLQLRYGGDGLDATQIEAVAFPGLAAGDADLRGDLALTPAQMGACLDPEARERSVSPGGGVAADQSRALEAELGHAADARDQLRAQRTASPLAEELDARVHVAFSPARVLANARARFGITSSARSDMAPSDVLASADALCERIAACGAPHREFTFHIRALVRRVWVSRRVLLDLRLSKEALAWALADAFARHRDAQAANGEMVGAIGAESIGEPCTQLTLNTFHFAGNMEKNVTLGVPRLKELLDVSRKTKTPSATLRLQGAAASSQPAALALAASLPLTRLRDVLVDGELQVRPSPHAARCAEAEWPEDQFLVDASAPFAPGASAAPSQYVLRGLLDAAALGRRGIDALALAGALPAAYRGLGSWEVHCDSCPAGPWGAPRIRVRLLGQSPALQDADHRLNAEACAREVANLRIGGQARVDGADVERVARLDVRPDGSVAAEDEFTVSTQGCRLAPLLCVPGVDWRRSSCNDVHEVLCALGVEAAASVLFHEIRRVLGFDGTYVNLRHIMLVADIMTMQGALMPISRHGINRMETGPLVRSSFEEMVDTLIDAAAFSTTDEAKGVTEKIMLGRLAPVGTGVCTLRAPAATAAFGGARRRRRGDDGAAASQDEDVVVRSAVTRPYRPAFDAGSPRREQRPTPSPGGCLSPSPPQEETGGTFVPPYREPQAEARGPAFAPISSGITTHMACLDTSTTTPASSADELAYRPSSPEPGDFAPEPGDFAPEAPDLRAAARGCRRPNEAKLPAAGFSVFLADTGRLDFGCLQVLLARFRG